MIGARLHVVRSYVRFTYIGFLLVPLIDQGEVLPMNDTILHLESGDVVEWLAKTYPFPRIDLSLLTTNIDELAAANDTLRDIALGYGPRKWGTTNNGLAYLLALVLEAIQQAVRDPG